MILNEAEKLYNKLAKEQVNEIINDYASSIASSSLSLLASSDEEQKKTHVSQPTLDNQKEIHKEKWTPLQLESNDNTKIDN